MEPIILSTDETSYDRVMTFLKTELAPAIVKVASCYNSLDIGQFDQEVYSDIIDFKAKNIKERFQNQVENDIRKTKFPSSISKMLDSDSFVAETMAELDKHIHALFQAKMKYEASPTSPQLFFDDIIIENGKPKIQEEKVLRRFQIVVDTESKYQVYKKMNEVVAQFDELRAFAASQNIQFIPHFEDYFSSEANGSITINAEVFGRFFESMESDLYQKVKELRPSDFHFNPAYSF